DDVAAANHREGFLERHAAHCYHFVVIELALPGRQLTRQVQLDSLVAETWNRDDRAEMVPARGCHLRLFAEFATGALERVLAGVAASCGNLAHETAHGVAILAQERNRH